MSKELDTSEIFMHSFRLRVIRLVASVAVPAGIMVFLWIVMQANARQITSLNEQKNSAVKGLDTIATLFDDKEEAEQAYGELSKLLQDEFAAVVAVPKRLSALGVAHGLRVQVTVKNKSTVAEGLARIDLEIRADGSLKNIVAYMQTIEQEPWFIRVDSFTIGRLTPQEFQVRLEAGVLIDDRPKAKAK